MYYIGTKRECESYNEHVVDGENYDGTFTINWAEPIQHPTNESFAILKHPQYDSKMELVESLSDDWLPQIEE